MAIRFGNAERVVSVLFPPSTEETQECFSYRESAIDRVATLPREESLPIILRLLRDDPEPNDLPSVLCVYSQIDREAFIRYLLLELNNSMNQSGSLGKVLKELSYVWRIKENQDPCIISKFLQLIQDRGSPHLNSIISLLGSVDDENESFSHFKEAFTPLLADTRYPWESRMKVLNYLPEPDGNTINQLFVDGLVAWHARSRTKDVKRLSNFPSLIHPYFEKRVSIVGQYKEEQWEGESAVKESPNGNVEWTYLLVFDHGDRLCIRHSENGTTCNANIDDVFAFSSTFEHAFQKHGLQRFHFPLPEQPAVTRVSWVVGPSANTRICTSALSTARVPQD